MTLEHKSGPEEILPKEGDERGLDGLNDMERLDSYANSTASLPLPPPPEKE